MKKFLLIVLVLLSIQAIAQKPQNNMPNHRNKMMDISAEDMATLQTKKMTLHLDLDEKQQKAIYNINLENAKERKTHMEARKSQKESGEIPSKEDRVKMASDRLDKKIAIKAKMKSILNPEQFAKWEENLV